MADVRAKAVLLTQAEAEFLRMLMRFNRDADPTTIAGVMRKLGGLTEPEPLNLVETGLHGGLRR